MAKIRININKLKSKKEEIMKNNRKIVLNVIKVLGIVFLLTICVLFILRDATKIKTYSGKTSVLTQDLQQVSVEWEVQYGVPFYEKDYDPIKHKLDMDAYIERTINNPISDVFTMEELYVYKNILEVYVNSIENEELNIRKTTFIESTFYVDVVWDFKELSEEEIKHFIKKHYNKLQDNLNADLIAISSAFPYASRERHIEILGNKYEGLLTFNNLSESREWYYTDEDVSEELTFEWSVDSLDKSFKVQLETGVYNPPKK